MYKYVQYISLSIYIYYIYIYMYIYKIPGGGAPPDHAGRQAGPAAWYFVYALYVFVYILCTKSY